MLAAAKRGFAQLIEAALEHCEVSETAKQQAKAHADARGYWCCSEHLRDAMQVRPPPCSA